MAIKFCGCNTGQASEWQDKKYGKGQRIFTIPFKGEGKCTCCGKAKISVVQTKKK